MKDHADDDDLERIVQLGYAWKSAYTPESATPTHTNATFDPVAVVFQPALTEWGRRHGYTFDNWEDFPVLAMHLAVTMAEELQEIRKMWWYDG